MTSNRFVTVAWVYDPSELALLLALFEQSDIWVVPMGRHHVAIDWSVTVALGGVRLRVHEENVAAALALLAGLERTPQRSVRYLFQDKMADLLLILLVFCIGLWAAPARIQAEFAVARRERSA